VLPVWFLRFANDSAVAVRLLPIPIIPNGASCAILLNCVNVLPAFATFGAADAKVWPVSLTVLLRLFKLAFASLICELISVVSKPTFNLSSFTFDSSFMSNSTSLIFFSSR
jgi:hypothetical protein